MWPISLVHQLFLKILRKYTLKPCSKKTFKFTMTNEKILKIALAFFLTVFFITKKKKSIHNFGWKLYWLAFWSKYLQKCQKSKIPKIISYFTFFCDTFSSEALPLLSSIWQVVLHVYSSMSVCSLLRYRLNVFLRPLSRVGCQIFLEIRNPWGKVMERSGLRLEHFCLKVV